MPNTYWLVDLDGTVSEVTPTPAVPLGFARDFHLDVLRSLNEDIVRDISFYICIHPPERLPRYGPDVVLVILGDEYHITLPYFANLLAVLRCYGTHPTYLDGVPTTFLHLSALVQFGYKTIRFWKQKIALVLEERQARWKDPVPTLHIPLGCFSNASCVGLPFDERPVDFAFLGSIGTSGDNYEGLSLRTLISPPKIRARRDMVAALERIMKRGKWNGVFRKTATFADSTSQQSSYDGTMAQTKISICPRGSNYETYRFFESCRLGCVIVCDPLPDVWFYKDHPGIVINDWERLPELLDELLQDGPRLADLAAASRRFWDVHLSERAISPHVERFLVKAIHNNQSRPQVGAATTVSSTVPAQ